MNLLTPEGNPDPSRRSIATSLFFSGYAVAALSSCASPVTTPGEDLILEDVHIDGAGGYRLPAFVARPNDRRRHGAIVVVNEIFGIHDYIKDICRRLAREGYVAIAPDYFDRGGDPAAMSDFQEILAVVAQARHEQVMGDTGGAIEWLARQSHVGDGIGVTGFCWGGTVVWMAAARFERVKAGVAWYGRLIGDPTSRGYSGEQGRPWPLDVSAQVRAPVLGLYAENDNGIPVSTVDQMRAALAAAGNPSGSEIIVYPGAAHGFHADYRDSYNADAAADGWARALAWFRAHGVR